jgi:hypothetical protein
MHVVDIDPEKWIGQPARLRRVGKVDVDDERSESGEKDAPAPFATCDECVVRVNYTITVLVEV